MRTHFPGFNHCSSFLHTFVLARLATSSIRFNSEDIYKSTTFQQTHAMSPSAVYGLRRYSARKPFSRVWVKEIFCKKALQLCMGKGDILQESHSAVYGLRRYSARKPFSRVWVKEVFCKKALHPCMG